MKKTLPIAFAAVLALAPALPASAAADGKALYNSKCAMCHGQDGVPKKMGAGSKAFGDPEFKKAATIESIVKDTVDGKGTMKPIKTLTDEEVKAIAAHVLTIGAK